MNNYRFISTSLRRNYNDIIASGNLKNYYTDYQDTKFNYIKYNNYKHKHRLIDQLKLIDQDRIFNNTQILVTVIMPTYNQEKFIEQSVQSIINQSHSCMQFIIVDDGSTDSTPQILSRLKLKYKQIEIITKPNGGTGSAINEGLKIAVGEYITWVSSDNIYYPNFLTTLVDVLETEITADYVFSTFDWFNVQSGMKSLVRGFSGNPLVEGTYPKKYMKQGYDIGMCFLYRTKLLNRIHFYDNRQGEDYLFAVKSADFAEFYFVDESLGQYNDHGDTLSRKKPEKTHETEILAKQLAQKFV